ncbi:MAG: heme exporter protein CcmD [Casimicrobiaceae bacterium]|nr:heme exporter protein CcmD [Casimicrobiaceae bacterium]
MIWESWSAFWAMGGRGAFVWGSYGVWLLLVVAELWALARARKRALERFRESELTDPNRSA